MTTKKMYLSLFNWNNVICMTNFTTIEREERERSMQCDVMERKNIVE